MCDTATFSILPASMILTQFSNSEVLAQSETTLADRVLSYITEAETSITAGNTTDASDKLGLAVAELSNLIGEITSDNGRHTDTLISISEFHFQFFVHNSGPFSLAVIEDWNFARKFYISDPKIISFHSEMINWTSSKFIAGSIQINVHYIVCG